MTNFTETKALTFDLFGTILDLGGSLTPFIGESLDVHAAADVSADEFWAQWRYRQRIEQYQDTIMMLGHSGYLETVRRALHYTLKRNSIEASVDTVKAFMQGWQQLSSFPEVLAALSRLQSQYRLVVLSNGDPAFLDYLVEERVTWDFDAVISVTSVGAFKPHPAVYRAAAGQLGLEVNECLMVSANSFDIMGARACGYKGAFVNRYRLPYEDTAYQPDVTVSDFTGLAEALL
ncbi:haloacid dehalogenase type II [Candidatus Poribacteria bacterium]|nr:haloacid dehalogenase type II [Candidatus Poribacteria bacterium]MYG07427.1 haloacid dehalogenase type II [Candidatus Poribacteria bacterium]MYK24068.1 haloacid dehalogenase type II [Candidatus Poribacteria bacterium]